MYCIIDNSCCTINSVSICVSMSVLSFRVATYLQSSEWTLSTAYMCVQVLPSWTFNRLIINLYKVQTHLAWFLNVCYHHHENKIYRYDEEYKDNKLALSSLSLFSMLWMDWLTVWCTGRILYSLVAPCPETRPHQHPVSGRVYRLIASTWSSHWSTCPEEWAPYKTRSNISFWIRSNLKLLQPHQKSVDWKFLNL